MGRTRKYQVSVGLSADLISILDTKITEGEFPSRSALVEKLIRESIQERCLQCEIIEKLNAEGVTTWTSNLPKTMDEANEMIHWHKNRLKRRNQEKVLIDIVSVLQNDTGAAASLIDVLTEGERRDIPRSKAEDIIDKLCRDGRMMRTSGYDSLMVV